MVWHDGSRSVMMRSSSRVSGGWGDSSRSALLALPPSPGREAKKEPQSEALAGATGGGSSPLLSISASSSGSRAQKTSVNHSGVVAARFMRSISRQNSSKSTVPELSASTASIIAFISDSGGVWPS